MNEWYNDIIIAFGCYFSLEFRFCKPLNQFENNERYELKPRRMFVQRSNEISGLLVGGRIPLTLRVGEVHPPNQLIQIFQSELGTHMFMALICMDLHTLFRDAGDDRKQSIRTNQLKLFLKKSISSSIA